MRCWWFNEKESTSTPTLLWNLLLGETNKTHTNDKKGGQRMIGSRPRSWCLASKHPTSQTKPEPGWERGTCSVRADPIHHPAPQTHTKQQQQKLWVNQGRSRYLPSQQKKLAALERNERENRPVKGEQDSSTRGRKWLGGGEVGSGAVFLWGASCQDGGRWRRGNS